MRRRGRGCGYARSAGSAEKFRLCGTRDGRFPQARPCPPLWETCAPYAIIFHDTYLPKKREEPDKLRDTAGHKSVQKQLDSRGRSSDTLQDIPGGSPVAEDI